VARRVFFSFDHRDLWRANVVRNSMFVDAVMPTGFHDAAAWEEAGQKGEDQLSNLIELALDGTSVTVVLIGAQTANRRYVTYEIERSVARGNALLGIRIEKIKDFHAVVESPGPIPPALARESAPVFEWQYGRLSEWIEEAYRQKHRA
jgi:hypothetical protein